MFENTGLPHGVLGFWGGFVMPQQTAGRVGNREKARLEGVKCARAQCTRSEDGENRMHMKHDAMKHGKIVRNM